MKKTKSLALYSLFAVAFLAIPAIHVNAQDDTSEEAPEFIFSFGMQFPETDAIDVPEENLRPGVIVADGPPFPGGPGTIGSQLNLLLEDPDPDVPPPLVASVTAQGITFTVTATSVDENGNLRDAAFSAGSSVAGVDTFDPDVSEGRILINPFETLVITMTFDPSLEVTLTEIDLERVAAENRAAFLTISDNPELALFFDIPTQSNSVLGYDFLTDTYTPPEEIVISSGDSIVLGSNSDAGLRDLTLRIGSESKVVLGDVNLDGEVDFLDIGPFVELITTGQTQAEADINGDGMVTFLDIGPFVALLTAT